MTPSASVEIEDTEEKKEETSASAAPQNIPATRKNPKAKVAKIQLFLNYKGGTGKTSISAAYGYFLAQKMGKRVLLVDLDPQAHLTTCFDQESIHRNKSLYGVIVSEEKFSDIIIHTSAPTLNIVPSSISLSALELPLFKMPLREYKLRKILKSIERNYDYIIIDSAPNIGLLSLNAILASDDILIPLLADFLSFHGLKILLETLASIERDFNYYVENIHIFLNRYNTDYSICRECQEAIHKFYPQYSLKTIINESQEIIDASSSGKSVFELHPNSKAAEDIQNLVYEINGFDKGVGDK